MLSPSEASFFHFLFCFCQERLKEVRGRQRILLQHAESALSVDMRYRSKRATEEAAAVHAKNIAPTDTAAVSPRPEGSVYMGGFRAPKIECVRVAVIGLGERGARQTSHFLSIPHSEVVAVCDPYAAATGEAAGRVEQCTGKRPAEYNGSPQAYKTMLAEVKPHAVLINTPWEMHAPMAIDAMEAGAHAFVEVPLALTLEDLWRVVDASERTQKHCMMLENCNYGRHELMFLNMVRQGLIGELLHGEAAYIHELRMQMFSENRGCGSWRTNHYAARNGNLYPTHGLGPVAQYMSLARGEDSFDRLVSLSSPARGRAAYAKKNFAPDHKWNKLEFKCGDMSNSIIKTKLGRTILVQWDETSPRPYDRKNLIQGTEGTLADYPLRVAGERISPGASDSPEKGQPGGAEIACEGGCHEWYEGKEAEAELYALYDHPLYKRLGEEASRKDNRGGMNYIMLYRVIECLHNGEPMDQNVYEGAFWSAVGPLSEKSVNEGGAPQIFPDFTRGDWRKTAPLPVIR